MKGAVREVRMKMKKWALNNAMTAYMDAWHGIWVALAFGRGALGGIYHFVRNCETDMLVLTISRASSPIHVPHFTWSAIKT